MIEPYTDAILLRQGSDRKQALVLLGRKDAESFLGEGSEGTCVRRHSAVLDILTITVANEALCQW